MFELDVNLLFICWIFDIKEFFSFYKFKLVFLFGGLIEFIDFVVDWEVEVRDIFEFDLEIKMLFRFEWF